MNLRISDNQNIILNKGGFLRIFMQKGISIPNLVFCKLLPFSFIGGQAKTASATVTFFLKKKKKKKKKEREISYFKM